MSNPNDYTKPSRVKRRLKRRWKKQQLSNFTYCPVFDGSIKLTAARLAATMPTLLPSLETVGRRNPFKLGEKSPQPYVAFLCASFSAALCRAYHSMTGCFGQRSALAAPSCGFRPHFSPSPDSVETIGGGLFLQN
ncbi:MAG: hypothetical protein ACXWF8_00015 [Methylobacter sp.]